MARCPAEQTLGCIAANDRFPPKRTKSAFGPEPTLNLGPRLCVCSPHCRLSLRAQDQAAVELTV
jgi:hypothetical protein